MTEGRLDELSLDVCLNLLRAGTVGRFSALASTPTTFVRNFDPHPWLADERDTWLIVEPFSITGRHLKPDEPNALLDRTLCRLPNGRAEAKP